jgi:hypothetical protein
MRKHVFIILAFLILAGLLRFWIAPALELLPSDYTNATALSEVDKFRDSPTGEWQASTLNTQRIDQTITHSGQTAIIEGALHVYYASGAVNFETTSLYGVDRRTRLNLSGYGSVNRTGQYFFPPHVQPGEYPIWDPMFVGLRQATFQRAEIMDGLQVYVFSFSTPGMDETTGYSYLPDVPERYLVHTDGAGTIWVEPLSGFVVDYMDSGVSYFVDPATGTRLADFNQWKERYIPGTRAAQIALARAARLRILALEVWLPGGLLLVALVFLGLILFQRRKTFSQVDRPSTGLKLGLIDKLNHLMRKRDE